MMLSGQVIGFTSDIMWHELTMFYVFEMLLLRLKDLNDFMMFWNIFC